MGNLITAGPWLYVSENGLSNWVFVKDSITSLFFSDVLFSIVLVLILRRETLGVRLVYPPRPFLRKVRRVGPRVRRKVRRVNLRGIVDRA